MNNLSFEKLLKEIEFLDELINKLNDEELF